MECLEMQHITGVLVWLVIRRPGPVPFPRNEFIFADFCDPFHTSTSMVLRLSVIFVFFFCVKSVCAQRIKCFRKCFVFSRSCCTALLLHTSDCIISIRSPIRLVSSSTTLFWDVASIICRSSR